MGKSCPTLLIAVCDKVTGFLKETRAQDGIYLDFRKALMLSPIIFLYPCLNTVIQMGEEPVG